MFFFSLNLRRKKLIHEWMLLVLPLALLLSWSEMLGVLDTMVDGDSLCSNLATLAVSELSQLTSLITP